MRSSLQSIVPSTLSRPEVIDDGTPALRPTMLEASTQTVSDVPESAPSCITVEGAAQSESSTLISLQDELASMHVANAVLAAKLCESETELKRLQASQEGLAESLKAEHELIVETMRTEAQAKLDAACSRRQAAMDSVSTLLRLAHASEVAAFADSQAKLEAEKAAALQRAEDHEHWHATAMRDTCSNRG